VQYTRTFLSPAKLSGHLPLLPTDGGRPPAPLFIGLHVCRQSPSVAYYSMCERVRRRVAEDTTLLRLRVRRYDCGETNYYFGFAIESVRRLAHH